MFLYRIVLITKHGQDINGHWVSTLPSVEDIESDVSLYGAQSYRIETKDYVGTKMFLYTFFSEESDRVEKVVATKLFLQEELDCLKKKFNLPLYLVESVLKY